MTLNRETAYKVIRAVWKQPLKQNWGPHFCTAGDRGCLANLQVHLTTQAWLPDGKTAAELVSTILFARRTAEQHPNHSTHSNTAQSYRLLVCMSVCMLQPINFPAVLTETMLL